MCLHGKLKKRKKKKWPLTFMGLFTPNATVDWRVVGEKDKRREK